MTIRIFIRTSRQPGPAIVSSKGIFGVHRRVGHRARAPPFCDRVHVSDKSTHFRKSLQKYNSGNVLCQHHTMKRMRIKTTLLLATRPACLHLKNFRAIEGAGQHVVLAVNVWRKGAKFVWVRSPLLVVEVGQCTLSAWDSIDTG